MFLSCTPHYLHVYRCLKDCSKKLGVAEHEMEMSTPTSTQCDSDIIISDIIISK